MTLGHFKAYIFLNSSQLNTAHCAHESCPVIYKQLACNPLDNRAAVGLRYLTVLIILLTCFLMHLHSQFRLWFGQVHLT